MTPSVASRSARTSIRARSPIAWFSISVGALIVVSWTLLFALGQVPEIDQGDRAIWFHLTAEIATAGLLGTAGAGMLTGRLWGDRLAGPALGALLYTTINSTGHYAATGGWAPVVMFGLLALTTALVTGGWVVRRFEEGR